MAIFMQLISASMLDGNFNANATLGVVYDPCLALKLALQHFKSQGCGHSGVLALFLVLGGINTAILLGIGAFRIMDGNMTIGMLVAFQSLMQSFLMPVEEMVNQGSQFQELEGDMARIDDVLRYEPAHNRGTDEMPEQARPASS